MEYNEYGGNRQYIAGGDVQRGGTAETDKNGKRAEMAENRICRTMLWPLFLQKQPESKKCLIWLLMDLLFALESVIQRAPTTKTEEMAVFVVGIEGINNKNQCFFRICCSQQANEQQKMVILQKLLFRTRK